MNLDEKVRFVTILDKSEMIIFGGQREGIINNLKLFKQKKFLNQIKNGKNAKLIAFLKPMIENDIC